MKTMSSGFKASFMLLLFGVFMAGCGGGGGSSSSGTTTTTTTLAGTAAKGAAFESVTVAIKDKNGSTKTGTTGTDGKYSIDTTGMTGPFLLKVSDGTNTYYSVSTATGTATANIHPFTDLIIRNWYKVKGADIDTDFSGSGALTHVPTASEIDTIEAVIRNILSSWLSNVGIDIATFNLITTSFNADTTGFDKVLDNTGVVIDATGNVTVTTADPTTGIESTMVTTTISTNLTTADTTKPSDPTGLAAIPAGTTSILLAWNASTDNIGLSGYNVYRGGSKVASSPYPLYSDTGLTSGTNYCYQVEAFDGAGNISANKSSEVCATPAADTTAPSAPTGLAATAASSSQINLSWTASASTDVVGYAIYRGGTKIAAVTGTSYSDTGLASGTLYSYTVKALDGALNLSADSNSASATPAAATASDFVGTWIMATENGEPVSGETVTFVFDSNGNWSYTAVPTTPGTTCTGSGTYSTSGSNLTIVTTTESCPDTGDVFPKTRTGTYTVTATTLTTVLTNSTPGDSAKTTVFTK